MAVYEYTGKDGSGKTVKGVLDVDGVRALKNTLRRDRIFLIEYHETNARGKGKGKIGVGGAKKQGSREVDLE